MYRLHSCAWFSGTALPLLLSLIHIYTSTSAMESLAVLSIRLPSLLWGLCTPGVSSRTYCKGPRVMTPVIRVRVVWGLEVTIATFSPRCV